MGKGNDVRGLPPAQKQRKEVGNFKRKIDKKEATAVHNQAVARKQEFPIKKLLLGFIAFAAASTLLYLYLGYIAAEDEEEV